MIPNVLGPYDVDRLLGSGGMADVYLGRHRQLRRLAAIKVPHRDVLETDARERFLEEVATVAGLDHSAIVPVYEFGETDDLPYMAMRYMTGGSLADRLTAGAYSPDAVLPILARVAAALDFAHSKGVIHRDVKPGNILFDGDGWAYLSDFGIARMFALDGDQTQQRRTAPGVARGTFTYSSPEQAQARSDLDHRSDLYSLGVVAFEILTGNVPYQADSGVQLGVLHVTAPIPSICERRPELPPATQGVIDRALAKRPAERYTTGEELVADLQRALAERAPALSAPAASAPPVARGPEPMAATVSPTVESVVASAGGRRWRGALWIAGLLALLAVGLALGYLWSKTQISPPVANQTPAATTAATSAPTATPKTEATAAGEIIHIVAAGENLFRIGLRYGFAMEELAAYNGIENPDVVFLGQEIRIPPREGSAASRPSPTAESAPVDATTAGEGIVFQSNRDGDYDIYFLDLASGEQTRLTNGAASDSLPRVSPDGQHILFVSERDGNEEVYVMNRDGSGQTRLTNDPAKDNLPAWSPDGQQIVFVSSRDGLADLFVMDSDGNNVRQITDTPLREGHVSWSTRGQLAYNASDELYWQLYVADAGEVIGQRITHSTYDEWSPEWSPDGEWLLFHSERDSRTNPGIYRMRPDGTDAQLLYNGEGEEWGASWSPDGTQIVFASDQADGTANLFIMNADGRAARQLLERGGYPSWARALDGAATAAPRQALVGEGLVRLTFGEKAHYSAVLAADQSYILLSAQVDGRWQIFAAEPDGGGLRRQITHGQADHYQPEPLPGRQSFLAAADLDGDMDIYEFDLATGEPLTQLTDNPDPDYAPRALPDGSGFLFTSERDGDAEIYGATFDGNQAALTQNTVFDGFPSVSADGQWIAFQSNRDGDYEIYVIHSDGGQLRRLTVSAGRDASPAFSPDGRQVVFESKRSGNYEIYAVPFSGGETQQLTDSPGGNWVPSVSPDGHWLLFQSDREGYMDIYRQPLPFDGGEAPLFAGVPATIVVSTATPVACAATTSLHWAGLSDDARQRLGCATGAAVAGNGAFQYYDGGLMIWREDMELVYVLYNDGELALYSSSGPEDYYVTDLRKGAFGYLWDNNDTVREHLSEPLAIEKVAGGFTAQEFVDGVAVYFDDSGGQTYALFDEHGTWTP